MLPRLLALAALALSSPALAQCPDWAFAGNLGPNPRQDMFIVADTANRNILQFGGYRGGFGFNNETWLYDGESWAQAFPPLSPSARGHYAITYDSLRRRAILFGGTETGSNYLADTWSYDGTTWQLMSVGIPGVPRDQNGQAFLPGVGTVIFGGYAGAGDVRRDTWVLACPAPPCDPDFTCDGNIDQEDVRCMVDALAGNPDCQCQPLDFNNDGNEDQDDLADLIHVIAGGGCP
jgi:hypothetical protein